MKFNYLRTYNNIYTNVWSITEERLNVFRSAVTGEVHPYGYLIELTYRSECVTLKEHGNSYIFIDDVLSTIPTRSYSIVGNSKNGK